MSQFDSNYAAREARRQVFGDPAERAAEAMSRLESNWPTKPCPSCNGAGIERPGEELLGKGARIVGEMPCSGCGGSGHIDVVLGG